jgi:solute carrier family 30 (zinc transporter), member 9
VFLIQNNRKLLLGRAMSPTETSRVLRHLERDPVVAAVYDAKSEELGPGIYRFKAEIAFSG